MQLSGSLTENSRTDARVRESHSMRIMHHALRVSIASAVVLVGVFAFSASAEAAVYTSPPANVGPWGVYPNCIAPAIPIEVHSWWDEDANPAVHADANRYTNDNAPRHIHLAACVPNARNDDSVSISQNKLSTPMRVVAFNNPSVVNISQARFFDASGTPPSDIKMTCNTSVASHKYVDGRSECVWYVDVPLDPSTAPYGVSELRLSPNVADHVDLSTRQFATLNFQVAVDGKSGRYRSNNDPIGRTWYTGLDYANINVGYMDQFKTGELDKIVPVVSGVVPIRVKSANLSGTAKVAIWEDTNHHAAPTAWKDAQVGDIHPSGGRLVFLRNGNFDGTFNWDTRGLTDGRHKMYFQSQETNEKGVQAGALLLFYDVCNSGSCADITQPTFNYGLTNGGSRSVVQGQSVTNIITATLLSGTSQSASFSASGLPTGATASFSPASCSPSCSTTMTIATSASTPLGSYTVTAIGTAGGVTRTTPFTLTVNASSDTTAPSTPANLSATAISDSQINLSWTASTDNVGVLQYRLERCLGSSCTNFAQIATPTGTSYSNTGLSANTTYRYRVRAADAAGNVSGYSNIASATTPAPPPDTGDHIPPTVSITAPASGATVSGAVTISASASDNVGVVSVRLLIDDVGFAIDTSAPYSFNWDTATVSNGTHTIVAVAADAAENEGESAPITVTVAGGTTFPVDLQGNTPEKRTISVNVTKPSNVSDATLTMSGFDLDNANEGELFVNGNGPLALFGVQASSANDLTIATVAFNTPASWWVNGANALRFRHTDTLGYRIDALSVQFSGGGGDTTGQPSLTLSPATGSYPVNGTISTAILLNTASRAIDGVDIRYLRFNPTLLEVIDENTSQNGIQIQAGTLMPITTANTADNALSTILFSQVAGAGTTFSNSAPQALATTRFRVKAAGTASLSFDAVPGSTTDTNIASGGTDILGIAGTASYTLSAQTLIGDFNNDGAVNSLDWSYMNSKWNTNDAAADLNDDGIVNSIDYSLLVQNLGSSGGATDTTAPSTPTNLSATAISSSQIHLSWGASTDASGIANYELERCSGSTCTNFVQIATPTGTSYSNTGLTANTTYRFRVRAKDSAGLFSGYSNIVSATTPSSTSFDFSLSNSGNVSVTQGQSTTRTITANYLTGTAATVSFSASGLPSGATYTYSPISCTPTCSTTKTIVTSASTPTGTYTITVTGTSGGLSRTTSFTLTVTSAAVSGFPVNLQGTALPEEKTVTLSVSKPSSPTGATLVMSAYDADYASEGNVYINGNGPVALFGARAASGNDAQTVSVSYATDPSWWMNGNNTLRFIHTQTGGFRIDSASVNFTTGTTDTAPPAVSMTAPANGATVSGTSVTVSASASDNVGVAGVQFYITGPSITNQPFGAEDTTSPYSLVWDTTTGANGSYTITARARDATGNQTTSSGVTVTVSNTITPPPPPPGGGITAANFTVAFTADTEAGSVFQSVLNLIKNERVNGEPVDALFVPGDLSYGGLTDDDRWISMVNNTLGSSFPVFMTKGNHEDSSRWSAKYGPFVANRISTLNLTSTCIGQLSSNAGRNTACTMQGFRFVLSDAGESSKEDSPGTNTNFINSALTGSPSIWRLCTWHRNQHALNGGGKGDEVGWAPYEACRNHGAMIVNGHEHSYTRTKSLINMITQTVDPAASTASAPRVAPGSTFVVVAGTGGKSPDSTSRTESYWAKVAGNVYGALFITFNVDGDPRKATGYFKKTNGEVIDQFTVRTDVNP